MLDLRDRLRHEIVGPMARESIAYCIISPENGALYLLYSWVNAQDRAGYAFAIYEGGPAPSYFERRENLPANGQNFDDWKIGDLSVKVGPDFGYATASYSDASCSLELEFLSIHDAFDYAQNAAGCPTWQATNRYEQSGRIRGTLRRGDRTFSFDGPGHRDHSWGRRDWDALHHYKWLSIAGEDRAANIMIALVEGETIFNGYVFRDGVLSPIVSATTKTEYDKQWFQETLSVSALDEAGRTTPIDFPSRFAIARWDYSPTCNFTDAAMTGTLSGGPVQAYTQYVWNRQYLDRLLSRA